jgi:ElaB/YqjD/DUF883 family membrane-anchored ribosome-binding protein
LDERWERRRAMTDDPGDTTRGFTETLRNASHGAGESAQAFAQAASARISEAAREASRQAGADAAKLADEAGGQIKDFLKDKIGRGAGVAHEAANAARAFADQIDSKAPNAAKTVRDAAARFDGLAQQVGGMGPDELLASATDYARREPVVFLGAAAAIGFLAARLFKSAPVPRPIPAPASDLIPGDRYDDS